MDWRRAGHDDTEPWNKGERTHKTVDVHKQIQFAVIDWHMTHHALDEKHR